MCWFSLVSFVHIHPGVKIPKQININHIHTTGRDTKGVLSTDRKKTVQVYVRCGCSKKSGFVSDLQFLIQ